MTNTGEDDTAGAEVTELDRATAVPDEEGLGDEEEARN